MTKPSTLVVFASRLKQARKALGISQAELGVRMGLPEDVASTRINRYEKAIHAPDLETAERMAKELGVPLAYLVTRDETLARAILGFSKLPKDEQARLLKAIEAAGG
jgi:transcriptional regulator with XRE-family HTH domain